jgi:hypothetical protein
MKELMSNIHNLVLARFAGEYFLPALILMWGLAHKHLSQHRLVLALPNSMLGTRRN